MAPGVPGRAPALRHALGAFLQGLPGGPGLVFRTAQTGLVDPARWVAELTSDIPEGTVVRQTKTLADILAA